MSGFHYLEFKVADTNAELENQADVALEQIEDKKYALELKSLNYNNIIKYGIAFYKKDCIIKSYDDKPNNS